MCVYFWLGFVAGFVPFFGYFSFVQFPKARPPMGEEICFLDILPGLCFYHSSLYRLSGFIVVCGVIHPQQSERASIQGRILSLGSRCFWQMSSVLQRFQDWLKKSKMPSRKGLLTFGDWEMIYLVWCKAGSNMGRCVLFSRRRLYWNDDIWRARSYILYLRQ